MKHIKKIDHYLLKNEHGSYHINLEEYEKLGKDKAEELAKKEIKRKLTANYIDSTIDFTRARELGFCKYGINEFCDMLSLDKSKEYKITDLHDKLTLNAFKKYPKECLKLFGKSVIDKFGGVIGLLESNKTDSNIFYLVVNNFVEDDILHKFSVKAAYYSLKNFEKEFPNDNRPRLAIEAKEKFIKGEITKKELSAARSAALSAARSATWSAKSAAKSAARSAESAVWSTRSAESAVWSAESAARSAWSTASAAYGYFSEELIKLIEADDQFKTERIGA